VLRKAWRVPSQTGRPEGERRRLPRKAVRLTGAVAGRVLLVDDVWTTGTTLLRSAQALQAGGAEEVRVLTLFRALRG
ncbi:MAG TPA: phosphoribosyltransferase family protein, partial [Holophagaceae bacterium]|nr:phosphoribosyltransferase family protein [Holophagaceae bacterium]